jgi:MFS family permease
VISNTGTWVQNVTASILIFSLTGSAFLVGVLNFATFAPILLFSVPAGMLADRVDRRFVVVVTSAISALAAAALAVVTLQGRVTATLLVAVAAVLGTAYAFAKPATSSLLPALVPRDEVPRATVVNTMQFTVGQVAGSALASLLLATAGPGWAFGVNAVTFLAPIGAMLLIHLPPSGSPRSKGRRGALQGFRFLRSAPGLLAVLLVVVLNNSATEMLRTLAPSIATRLLERGESAAALIVTSYSMGAAAGLLLFGTFLRVLSPPRAIAVASVLQVVGVLGVALSPSYPLTLAAAVPIGIGFSIAIPVLNAALQNGSPDEFRGRVMAAFAMAHLGVRPLFALLSGALAALAGARVAVLAFAAFAVLALVIGTRTSIAGDRESSEVHDESRA